MEDPITFDVWGVANGNGRPDLILALTSGFPSMTRAAVLLAVNKSVRERTPMLLAESRVAGGDRCPGCTQARGGRR